MAYRWIGSINAEAGGPLMITDLPGAQHWQGEKGHSASTGEWLLRWLGPWSSRLSSKFPRNNRLRVGSASDAQRWAAEWRQELDSLEPRLQAKKPTLGEGLGLYRERNSLGETAETTRFSDVPPDKRKFLERALQRELVCSLEMSPVNDFIEAYTALDDAKELAELSFDQQYGLIWSIEGAGTIHVGVGPDRREVIFLKVLFGEQDIEDKVKLWFSRDERAEKISEQHLVLKSPVAVALWSPLSGRDSQEVNLAPSALQEPLTILRGGGMLIPLQQGRYQVSLGRHETKAFAVRWCRFTLRDLA